ncbi:MAG: MFS transporter [Actinobacteria bacterium]|nr:MFS transporter [Actinomycetota bacterium]
MSFQKRSLTRPIYAPSFLLNATEAALLPVLPVSAVSYGLGLAEAGVVVTIMMVSAMLFEIPASWLTTKLGERRAMLLAATSATLSLSLAYFNLGYLALIAAAFGFGCSYALFGLARHSLLTHLTPSAVRPRAMALLGGMFRGGWAIGPIIGSGVIALFGLQSAYLLAMVLALSAGLIVFSVKAEKLASPPSGQHGNVWRVAKREAPKLLTLGIASGIISGARAIRLIGLPLLAVALEIDAATSSFIFGVTGLIDFALFYVSGIVMEKYGKVWSSVPTLLMLGIAYLFAFYVTDLTSFWILAAVTSLANAMSAGINMVLGADLAPDGARSEFLASFRLLTSGGSAFAPALISGLTAVAGLPAALAITGLSNFLGAYLFWKYLPIYAPEKSKD